MAIDHVARRREYELQGLLETLRHESTVIIRKAKLLNLLGRERDKQSAWKSLLESYEEIGGKSDELYGVEFWDGRVLLSIHPLEKISTWAGLEEKDE